MCPSPIINALDCKKEDTPQSESQPAPHTCYICPPLATTWCHIGHWMKRGTCPILEMDAAGLPPCVESRSQTSHAICTASTTLCAHWSLHTSTTLSLLSACTRVRPLASMPTCRPTEHLGLGLALSPKSRMSTWHQQLSSRGRNSRYQQ